ncbi:uncharacterized protein UHOD_11695 [Ustilago sp. UG-2017b]|nr:uncharacterized protein UHOD_11695 [Ustilago sp. UG-2017b]
MNPVLLRIRSYDNPLYGLTEGSPRKGAAIDMKEPRKHMFNKLKAAVQNMVLGLPQLDKCYYVTDHKGIVYFRTQCELTPHEYRYLDHIKQYDPHIIYRKGEENIVADALSRQPGLADNDEPSDDLKQVLVTRRRSALIGPSGPTTLERLTAEATNSELAIKPGMAEAVTEIIALSAKEALPSVDTGGLDDGDVAKALQKAEHWVLQLFVKDGHLFCLNKLGSQVVVITSFERACSLTKALHNEGGHRKQSTLKNLVMDWYAFLAMLAICRAVLITMIDYCTGQAHAFPTKNENTADALRMMENLIYSGGYAVTIQQRRSSCFSTAADEDNASPKQLDPPAESPAHSQSNDDDSGSKGKGVSGRAPGTRNLS